MQFKLLLVDIRPAIGTIWCIRGPKDLPAPKIVDLPLALVLGHVLAEDCASDLDMPPFDKAMMDGYAVRSADAQESP